MWATSCVSSSYPLHIHAPSTRWLLSPAGSKARTSASPACSTPVRPLSPAPCHLPAVRAPPRDPTWTCCTRAPTRTASSGECVRDRTHAVHARWPPRTQLVVRTAESGQQYCTPTRLVPYSNPPCALLHVLAVKRVSYRLHARARLVDRRNHNGRRQGTSAACQRLTRTCTHKPVWLCAASAKLM